MLFEFGKFWKSFGVVGICWALYLFFGYEFSVITMLAVLISIFIVRKKKFLY
jgi:hypothetical protein